MTPLKVSGSAPGLFDFTVVEHRQPSTGAASFLYAALSIGFFIALGGLRRMT
jgi:hypothetical protein